MVLLTRAAMGFPNCQASERDAFAAHHLYRSPEVPLSLPTRRKGANRAMRHLSA